MAKRYCPVCRTGCILLGDCVCGPPPFGIPGVARNVKVSAFGETLIIRPSAGGYMGGSTAKRGLSHKARDSSPQKNNTRPRTKKLYKRQVLAYYYGVKQNASSVYRIRDRISSLLANQFRKYDSVRRTGKITPHCFGGDGLQQSDSDLLPIGENRVLTASVIQSGIIRLCPWDTAHGKWNVSAVRTSFLRIFWRGRMRRIITPLPGCAANIYRKR